MPFIKAKTSCPVSPEQESELKAGMGKAIELVPGKSEESFTAEVTSLFVKVLNIRPDHIYIKYEDIIAWSVHGMYIDRNQYR